MYIPPLPENLFILKADNRPFLNGQQKRPKGAWSMARWFAIFLCLFLIGAFVVAWLVFEEGLLGRSDLERDGVEVEALVTQKQPTGDSFVLRYAFTIEGERFESSSSVNRSYFERTQNGDRIPIRYLPSNPSQNELVEGGTATDFNPFILSLLCGIPLVVLVVAEYNRSRLYRQGQVIVGEILRADRSVDTEIDEYNLRLAYQFQAPGLKNPIRGRTSISRYDTDFELIPPPNTPIAVLYLNPNRYEIL